MTSPVALWLIMPGKSALFQRVRRLNFAAPVDGNNDPVMLNEGPRAQAFAVRSQGQTPPA